MKKLLFILSVSIITIVISCNQNAGSSGDVANSQNDLQGIWQAVEDSFTSSDTSWINKSTQPGLYFFGKAYYSIMYIAGNKARPLMAEDDTRDSITDEQVRSIFRNFNANSGKYELAGSKFTIHPMVSLWPNLMAGGSIEYEYKVTGDTLSLTRNYNNGMRHYKLIRVE